MFPFARIARLLAAACTAFSLTITALHADDQTLTVGDKQFYTVSFGEGPPMLVLHGGLGLDHNYFLPALEPWGDFASLYFYDHEGNGRSSAPDDYAAITLDSMAQDVFDVADALGLDEFVLMGHSYGGFIAQVAALKHPERLRGVILASTSAKLGYPVVFPEWAPPEAQAAVGKLFSEPMPDDETWGATWRAALPAYWKDPAPEVLDAVHEATVYNAAAMRNSFGLLATFDVLEDLKSVEVPVLLLSGRGDFITGPQAHEDMDAALPNSTLVMFEESGHFPFITEAETYTAAVKAWLAGL